MANLNQEITHSLYFLSTSRQNLQSMIKLITECTNKIDRINITNPSFGGQVRKTTKDFIKDFNYEEEKFIHSYRLYMSEMTDIIANKADDKVIYNLERYKSSILWFVQFKKLLKKTTSLVMMKKDDADRKSDYVKLIAYKRVESAVIRITTMTERILNRLITLTGTDMDALLKRI